MLTSNGELAHGEDALAIPNTYLLVGRIGRYREGFPVVTDTPKFRPSQIVIAMTPDRIMKGTMSTRESGVSRGYTIAKRDMSHAVTLQVGAESKWQNAGDLLNARGMRVELLVRQQQIPDDGERSFHAAAESGLTGSAALAVFFGRYTGGHTPASLGDLLKVGSTGPVVSNDFGEFILSESDGCHVLQISKSAGNYSSTLKRHQTLGDFRSDLFKTGLASAIETCTFSTKLTDLATVPWTAVVKSVQTGNDGTIVQNEIHVEVTKFSTDAAEVNRIIDAVLAEIPEGTKVVTNEKLSYEWSDGNIQVVKDQPALKNADALTFAPPAPWWKSSVVPTVIAMLLIGAVFLVRRWGQQR